MGGLDFLRCAVGSRENTVAGSAEVDIFHTVRIGRRVNLFNRTKGRNIL